VAAGTTAPEAFARSAPSVRLVPIDPDAGARTLRADVTRLLDVARPGVVLTDHDALRRLAMRAAAPGTCVLHRLPLGTESPETTVFTRFAERRVHAGWLVPTVQGGPAVRGAPAAVGEASFPLPLIAPDPENGSVAGHVGFARARGPVGGAPAASGALLLLPDQDDVTSAMPALRAAAAVARHDATLRLVLLGDPAVMQPLRVLAAALRVASALDVLPRPAADAPWQPGGWPAPADRDRSSARQALSPVGLWSCARGDEGATLAFAAMHASLPLLVASDHDLAPTVRAHASGLVMPAGSPTADALAASALAGLCAHHDDRRRLAIAARAHAAEHEAAAAVDRLLLAVTRLTSTAHSPVS
jgi:hypothetical protein